MPPQPIEISVEHQSPDLVRINLGPRTLDLTAKSAAIFGRAIVSHAEALLGTTGRERMAAVVNQPATPPTADNRKRAAALIVELLNLVTEEGATNAQDPPTLQPPTADLPPGDRRPEGSPTPEAGQS